MTKMLDDAIAKVRELPEDEQNAAAGALLDYLGTMPDLQLTDGQLAEVRRRRGDPNRKTVPYEEAFQKLLGK